MNKRPNIPQFIIGLACVIVAAGCGGKGNSGNSDQNYDTRPSSGSSSSNSGAASDSTRDYSNAEIEGKKSSRTQREPEIPIKKAEKF